MFIMTIKELRQIQDEIKRLKSKQIVLENKATSKTQHIEYYPGTDIEERIQELESVYKESINKLSTDDFIHNCIWLKYSLGWSWTRIAMKIGGNNTANGIRMMCERCIW